MTSEKEFSGKKRKDLFAHLSFINHDNFSKESQSKEEKIKEEKKTHFSYSHLLFFPPICHKKAEFLPFFICTTEDLKKVKSDYKNHAQRF